MQADRSLSPRQREKAPVSPDAVNLPPNADHVSAESALPTTGSPATHMALKPLCVDPLALLRGRFYVMGLRDCDESVYILSHKTSADGQEITLLISEYLSSRHPRLADVLAAEVGPARDHAVTNEIEGVERAILGEF